MKTLAIRTLLGAGLVLGVCSQQAKAEDAAAVTEAKKAEGHVLSSKEFKTLPKGQILTIEELTVMKDGKMSISAGGKTLEGTMNRSESSVETLVSLGETTARRTLEKKTSDSKMTLNGQDRALPEEKDGLLGVPVLLEHKDGKGLATLESGATPKGDQVKALERLTKSINTHSDFAMYGDTPRKVGDKWNVDPKDLTLFGDDQKLRGTYALEFAEIKEFEGTPCAVLKAQFEITGDSNANEGPAMTLKFKGESIVHRSLADQVDLEVKVIADMTMDGKQGEQMTMHVEGPFRLTTKTALKKP